MADSDGNALERSRARRHRHVRSDRNVARFPCRGAKAHTRATAQGRQEIQGAPMTTVWVYVDTSKEVGDVDHLWVFASEEVAEAWFAEK
jgi:hypothetical protein